MVLPPTMRRGLPGQPIDLASHQESLMVILFGLFFENKLKSKTEKLLFFKTKGENIKSLKI